MQGTFFTLFEFIRDTLNSGIVIIIALAVIGFMWGIVRLLFSRENQVAKKEGRDFMLYGIFTLFVMTSVWGFVNLLSNTLTPQNYIGDVNTSDGPQEPTPLQDIPDLFENNNEQRMI